MSEDILPLFVEWTWTQVSPNVKIAESRDIVLLHPESKGWNVSNTMDHTRVNTIIISLGAAKQILRLTLLDSKQNKENHAPILSNIQTAEATIRQTPTYAHFGNISSTGNSIWRNTKKSTTLGANQLT